jgi:hypothetical protein
MIYRLLFILLIPVYSYCQSDLMYNGDYVKLNSNDSVSTKKLIYIYAGQSNTGLSFNMPLDSSKYSGIISGVGFYNHSYSQHWTNLNVGINTFIDTSSAHLDFCFGAEGPFSYNMVQLKGDRI